MNKVTTAVRAGFVLALAGTLAGSSAARAAVAFTVIDLGTLGGTQSQPADVNALGHVVGVSSLQGDGVQHAFLYDGAALRDLGTLGGQSSVASGINAADRVVGSASNLSGTGRVFAYAGGVMSDLGVDGFAIGVNDSNAITGTRSVAGNEMAFVLDGSGLHDLGTLGGRYSHANAINGSGQVVGYSELSANTAAVHGFLYAGGKMTDLSVLFGREITSGVDINDAGQIVATASSGGLTSSFLYRNGEVIDLSASCVPSALNNAGVIVGGFNQGSGGHACMIRDGTFVDLNTLLSPGTGWTLVSASAVSDAGHIAASGYVGGHLHAFLLSPSAPTTATTSTTIPNACTATTTTLAEMQLTAVCSADRVEHAKGLRKLAKAISRKVASARTLADKYQRKGKVSGVCTGGIDAALRGLQEPLGDLAK